MSVDRRQFVRLAGTAALGLAAAPAAKLIASQEETASSEVMHEASLPTGEPKTAERWAMVIDLKKCAGHEGCTKCIDACHDSHNVPDFGNDKDEIKWLWKESFGHAFHEQDLDYVSDELKHRPTLMLCNHCDNPACVRVCPTGATWKREDGIVMMDWHRCIGCRYCVVACPYGSRSFNYRDPRPFIDEINEEFPTRMRGVVEKCTFCEELLAKGQMPKCVDACEAGALVFGDLEDPNSNVSQLLHEQFAIRRKPALGTQPEVYYLV
ncbi:4Fe-4S dicluster domain-containing protein [bacterium]|nr:4Fe-4S dicluster domain-containing protein [bacterium]